MTDCNVHHQEQEHGNLWTDIVVFFKGSLIQQSNFVFSVTHSPGTSLCEENWRKCFRKIFGCYWEIFNKKQGLYRSKKSWHYTPQRLGIGTKCGILTFALMETFVWWSDDILNVNTMNQVLNSGFFDYFLYLEVIIIAKVIVQFKIIFDTNAFNLDIIYFGWDSMYY